MKASVLTMLGAVVVVTAALFTVVTANGSQEHVISAGYNDGGRWPAGMTELCVEDDTDGFPVAEAAEEFVSLVDIIVKDDCVTGEFTIYVCTINEPTWGSTGYWDAHYVNDEEASNVFREGRIRLNLAQAYRQTPHKWFLILVHEFGHAAGLEDVDDQSVDSVMVNGLIPESLDGLSELDRQQVGEIYGVER